jgi:3',5'-nucleoside bisphosphate phosphatase
MFADLHIHSALSACADDDMTPNNILNMAVIKGLDVIAVCDHNSCKQQPAIAKAAKDQPIQVIFGVEVTSSEEVHILCYFNQLADCMEFDRWLETVLMPIDNNEKFFGKQLVYDENDEVIDKVSVCLSLATSASLKEVVNKANSIGGKCVFAHAIGKSHGVIRQLGFIPDDIAISGIEVTDHKHPIDLVKTHPRFENILFFFNSDAHQLIDINERDFYITSKQWKDFWGEHL